MTSLFALPLSEESLPLARRIFQALYPGQHIGKVFAYPLGNTKRARYMIVRQRPMLIAAIGEGHRFPMSRLHGLTLEEVLPHVESIP